MVRSAVHRELFTTLSAAAALGTVALIVVAVTPSKQTTVLDFAPWKAPPWDSRAGQGTTMGGEWYDQPGDFVGSGAQKAPTQILFDPYAKPWLHEPLSSHSLAKERNDYAFDKYAKYYGYGSQFKAPLQSLMEESDPYRNDGEPAEAKQETQLYYQQRLNDFYHEETNRPLAVAGRQQMLAQPWQLDDSDRKLALAEKHQYYQQKFQRYFSGEDHLTRPTA